MTIKAFLHQRKYELLLGALLLHLFIGIFVNDLLFYRDILWPLNMVILGIASVGVFVGKGKWKNVVRNILLIAVIGLPIGISVMGNSPAYLLFLNFVFVLFFSFIFWEVIRFLLKPSYINTDIISASACGYLLLIEISTFLMQFLYYKNPLSIKGLNVDTHAETFMDLVYFSSITLTSIGFGDITPNTYITKLITALFGIAGQFYSVVLVGILISKFTSNNSN